MQGYPDHPGPGEVALYQGVCEGGPHHGKPLYHGEPKMPIARLRSGGKAVSWFGSETELIRIDAYEHQDGRWIWKEK
jgi:hypothetical protein